MLTFFFFYRMSMRVQRGPLRRDRQISSSSSTLFHRIARHSPTRGAFRKVVNVLVAPADGLGGTSGGGERGVKDQLLILICNPPEPLGDEFARMRAAVRDEWLRIFKEDQDIIQRMQQGRASPAFEGGVFSPALDAPTHQFHRWAARRL